MARSRERRDVFINKSNYCFVKMIAVFLFLKPYRQTHVYRASRAERGEVIVPGAVIFLVEDILDTYARFQNHGLQIEGVAGIQIPLLEFVSSVRLAGVHVRLRSGGRSSRYVPTGR
mgnify:CR=1 FL=1